MTIEEGKNGTETAEQQGQRILEFVQGAEFGTTQYEAASDFFDLKDLEQSLKQEVKNARSKKDDPEGNQYWGSRARISEQKIVLLEHQIDQNSSRVTGYQSAYVHLGIALEELFSIAHREAEGKFPENTEQQNFYVENLYDTVFNKAQDSVNSKRG